MPATNKNKRTCSNGHVYYKTSDCPVCPICEQEKKPSGGFLSLMSAPARRALGKEGITSIQQLSKWKEKDLLQLHGFGPSSLPKLRSALKTAGLTFNK